MKVMVRVSFDLDGYSGKALFIIKNHLSIGAVLTINFGI
jgi:hypothetical protein